MIEPRQYQVQLKDNNGKLIAFLENRILDMSWEWLRNGGCGACDINLQEDYDGALAPSFAEDYEINVYAPDVSGTSVLWYSGYIDRVTYGMTGSQETIRLFCLGYVNQLKQVIINDKEYGTSEIAATVKSIMSDYITSNTKITSNDFDDAYTKLLLHFEGADGSVTMIDDTGKVVMPVANAQIDTAQKKFGSASLLLDGTGDYISLADNNDWNLGAGDFTIDLWARFNTLPANNGDIYGMVGQYVDTNNWWSYYLLNSGGDLYLKFVVRVSGSYTLIITSGILSLSAATWYHLAVVRNDVTFWIYVDGVNKVEDYSSAVMPDFAANLFIGYHGEGAVYFDGWIDEVRISKGIARWVKNFTPPDSAYAINSNYDDTGFTMDAVYFNEDVHSAINKLAEIAGRREWGVRADKSFFFRRRDDVIKHWFHITEDFISFNPSKDFNPIITKIYLEGGESYHGTFSVTNRVVLREAIVSNSAIITQSVGQQYARMYLKEHSIARRSYTGELKDKNKRYENIIPLGRAAVNLRIGIKSLYDVATNLYDSGLKYDGGTESFQIERIMYKLTDTGIDVNLSFGPLPPSLAEDMSRLEYLITNERNI